MIAAYAVAGLERVMRRLYPEARHELFNETNRDEVTQDLIAWLAKAVASRPTGALPRAKDPRPGVLFERLLTGTR